MENENNPGADKYASLSREQLIDECKRLESELSQLSEHFESEIRVSNKLCVRNQALDQKNQALEKAGVVIQGAVQEAVQEEVQEAVIMLTAPPLFRRQEIIILTPRPMPAAAAKALPAPIPRVPLPGRATGKAADKLYMVSKTK